MGDSEKGKKSKSLPDHSHNFHRKHVRERFYEVGFKGMADHNVLEMLLFFGIPRRDTNQLAHDLIDRFGSFAGVFEANINDLVKVKGMTENAACLIKMMVPVYARYVENINKWMPTPTDPKAIAEILRPLYHEGSCRERVFMLCYDNMDHQILCRMLNEGDINSSAFDIREFVRVILESNCSSVIISHNHPHSISLPSKDDIRVTRAIIEVLKPLKVRLLDHIIVSDNDYTSMANHRQTLPLFYEIDRLGDIIKEKGIE